MRKLSILFTALMLGVGLWAENPPEPPAGEIICNGLLFHLVSNDNVELVRRNEVDPQYTGDIVVPEQFEFTDTQSRKYIFRVIWIGADAFKGCSITSVTLPASIEFIGDNAFANCEQLTSVTCLGTEPATLGTDVFADHNDALTIYVPIWTKETYQTAWAAYENLISLTDFDQKKEDALVLIQTARQGIQNTEINLWIDAAFNDILRGEPDAKPGIEEILEQIMTVINSVQIGKNEAKEELLGTMGEECTGCTAVEVTDGITTLKLYNPTKVSYIKQE